MPRRILASLLGVLPLLGGARARAEEPLPRTGEMTLAAERAVVFKDGHALVVKRGTATADESGRVFTEDVPDAATLGSFWAIPDAGGPRLLGMDAGQVLSTRVGRTTVTATRLAEVLAWNREEVATLELEDRTTVTGTVRDVLAASGSEVVVLQTPEGSAAIPLGRVRRLDMKVMRLVEERTTKTETPAKRLTFTFEGGAGERSLSLLYFRPGIRWIPTYRVQLPPEGGPADARLSLQAEVLNEAEDLVEVPLDLVVGVPNFRFAEVVSPFVLEPLLRDTLREAAPQLMGQSNMASNAAFRSRAGERRGIGRQDLEGAGALDLPPELTATGTQDLFVYAVPKTTLLRGHRAALPLFEAKAPIRHVHTWEVAPVREARLEAPSPGRGASPLALSAQRIWHQLEMKNATEVPWTTGAALVLRDGQPISQDLLTYTPRGATTRLPLTVAVDLRGEYEEEETGRVRDALKMDGHAYTRVERKAWLTVLNHKATAVEVETTFRVGGKVDEASEDGRVVVQGFRAEDWREYRGHPAVNNSSEVAWRLRLEPGAKVEAWVEFHYFLVQ